MNNLIQSKEHLKKIQLENLQRQKQYEKFMNIAINQAKLGLSKGEIPIGAVIVKDGKVIAKAYNKKEKLNCSIYHAEINAIIKASKKLGWRLDGCDMYVTLEPCPMCAGAIVSSRIANLIFGACEQKSGYAKSNYDILSNGGVNHKTKWVSGVCQEQCLALLTNFFKQKRK